MITEKRSHNRDRAGARQEHGGGTAGVQAAAGLRGGHLLPQQRPLPVLAAGGLRALHQPATEQTGRTHR